jgi:hypothetical protein
VGLGGEATDIDTDLADDGLREHDIDAIDLGQVGPADPARQSGPRSPVRSHSDVSAEELKAVLKAQYARPSSIHIARMQSKNQFLRYAGRYIRRPPIA